MIHNNKEFVPDEIEKINVTGKSLCEWIYTITDFWDIHENSEHKKAECNHAKEENEKTILKLKEKRAEIQVLSKRMAELE